MNMLVTSSPLIWNSLALCFENVLPQSPSFKSFLKFSPHPCFNTPTDHLYICLEDSPAPTPIGLHFHFYSFPTTTPLSIPEFCVFQPLPFNSSDPPRPFPRIVLNHFPRATLIVRTFLNVRPFFIPVLKRR